MNDEFSASIDIQLSLTKVARIVEDNAKLHVSSVKKLGEGLDFQTFLVNDNWVFRFPKRYSDKYDPISEQLLLRRLELSVAVPKIDFVWHHPFGYPEVISGHRFLRGTALERFRSDEVDQLLLAHQLATVLTELHNVDGNGVNSNSDQLSTLRGWSEDLDQLRSRLENKMFSKSVQTAIISYVDKYRFDLKDSEEVLIHGDLGADHILLNEQRDLSGIIDWSNHTIGTRFRDFAGLWRWGGDAFCAQVLSHYPIKPSLAELAFFRVLGLISCIARENLSDAFLDVRLRTRARDLLEARAAEITNKCPYESLIE